MRPHLTRRSAVAGVAAIAGLAAQRAAAAQGATMAYVGSYTPEGHGIAQYRFDEATGALESVGLAAQLTNPSWISLDSKRGRLFAISETDDFGQVHTGSVTAFTIDASTGALTRLNTVSSGGTGPAHMSLHPSGRFALVANYGGGAVAVLGIREDGSLTDPLDVQAAPALASPIVGDPAQMANLGVSDHTRPHMHMVAADPSGRFVLADDAGSDRIDVWRIDAAGHLTPASFAATPAGSAPRHFVFSADGRRLFNLQEHDGLLKAYRFDPATGALTLEQVVPTLRRGYEGSFLASELALTHDGRFLLAGARLRNTITTVAVGAHGLRVVGEAWTQGDHPRSFALDPRGRFLVCCNQRSDNLTTFRLDAATGALSFTGRFTPVGSPAVIAFHRLG